LIEFPTLSQGKIYFEHVHSFTPRKLKDLTGRFEKPYYVAYVLLPPSDFLSCMLDDVKIFGPSEWAPEQKTSPLHLHFGEKCRMNGGC
jgi:hypothetical protein